MVFNTKFCWLSLPNVRCRLNWKKLSTQEIEKFIFLFLFNQSKRETFNFQISKACEVHQLFNIRQFNITAKKIVTRKLWKQHGGSRAAESRNWKRRAASRPESRGWSNNTAALDLNKATRPGDYGRELLSLLSSQLLPSARIFPSFRISHGSSPRSTSPTRCELAYSTILGRKIDFARSPAPI